jgi:hypothetical protein
MKTASECGRQSAGLQACAHQHHQIDRGFIVGCGRQSARAQACACTPDLKSSGDGDGLYRT